MQLDRGIRSPSTMGALDLLVDDGVLAAADADVLATAYRFCEATRNRLFLVASGPGDALPPLESTLLLWLARSLDSTPSRLREDYRRVTRRAR